jgi:GR25 family glycosyltransferase involved in LPS biosynthesis
MNIKFYILGIQRDFRGESLYSALKNYGESVEIVWGIDGQDFVFPENMLDEEKSLFLYGRKLNFAEVACTMGHKLITKKAFSDSVDLAVILEDDVEIKDIETIRNRLLMLKKFAKPSIFFLVTHRRLSLRLFTFSPKNRICKVSRIYSNPGGAVAYAVNSSALQVIQRLPEATWKGVQSDFPPEYFQHLKMYSLHAMNSNIGFDQGSSVIGARPVNKTNFQEKSTKLFRTIWLILGPPKNRYHLSLRAYFAHFFGRAVAWRLNRPVK